MSEPPRESEVGLERWRYGRLVAVATILIVVMLCLIPVTATGSTDDCGTAIGAALTSPGPAKSDSPTRAQLCHPLGIDRLQVAAVVLTAGLVLSALVGTFAQPPTGPAPTR